MITFLYGTDTYRIKECVSQLTKKGDWEVFNLDDKNSFNNFEQSLKTVGLFGQLNNCVINEAFSRENIDNILQQHDIDKNKDREFIFECFGTKTELNKKNSELFLYLNSKKNNIEEYLPLDDVELSKWAIKLA